MIDKSDQHQFQLSIPFVLFETDAIWFRDPTALFEQANKIDDVDIKVPVKGYTGRVRKKLIR